MKSVAGGLPERDGLRNYLSHAHEYGYIRPWRVAPSISQGPQRTLAEDPSPPLQIELHNVQTDSACNHIENGVSTVRNLPQPSVQHQFTSAATVHVQTQPVCQLPQTCSTHLHTVLEEAWATAASPSNTGRSMDDRSYLEAAWSQSKAPVHPPQPSGYVIQQHYAGTAQVPSNNYPGMQSLRMPYAPSTVWVLNPHMHAVPAMTTFQQSWCPQLLSTESFINSGSNQHQMPSLPSAPTSSLHNSPVSTTVASMHIQSRDERHSPTASRRSDQNTDTSKSSWPRSNSSSSLDRLQTALDELSNVVEEQIRNQSATLAKLGNKRALQMAAASAQSESSHVAKPRHQRATHRSPSPVEVLTDGGNWRILDDFLSELGLPAGTSEESKEQHNSLGKEVEPILDPGDSDDEHVVGVVPERFRDVFNDNLLESDITYFTPEGSAVPHDPSRDETSRLRALNLALTLPRTDSGSSITTHAPATVEMTSIPHSDIYPPFDYGTDPYSSTAASTSAPTNRAVTPPSTSLQTSSTSRTPSKQPTPSEAWLKALHLCHRDYALPNLSERYINTLWTADIANERSISFYYT